MAAPLPQNPVVSAETSALADEATADMPEVSAHSERGNGAFQWEPPVRVATLHSDPPVVSVGERAVAIVNGGSNVAPRFGDPVARVLSATNGAMFSAVVATVDPEGIAGPSPSVLAFWRETNAWVGASVNLSGPTAQPVGVVLRLRSAPHWRDVYADMWISDTAPFRPFAAFPVRIHNGRLVYEPAGEQRPWHVVVPVPEYDNPAHETSAVIPSPSGAEHDPDVLGRRITDARSLAAAVRVPRLSRTKRKITELCLNAGTVAPPGIAGRIGLGCACVLQRGARIDAVDANGDAV